VSPEIYVDVSGVPPQLQSTPLFRADLAEMRAALNKESKVMAFCVHEAGHYIYFSGRPASASTMYGNFLLRDFLWREKKATVPFLTAIARYPSSLISHTQPGASGSFATARHSMGSMKAGSRVGRERSLALLTLAIGIV
jgi:hypothetical protein